MNKRNLFSLMLLTCVATISVAGIFGDTHDEDRTRVTGRRRMHILHGGESKSERRARRYGNTSSETVETKDANGRTVKKTTRKTTRRAQQPTRKVTREEMKTVDE